MRIRITDANQTCPEEYQDVSLSYFGVSARDEFDVGIHSEYGFVVNHCGENLFVRNSECEVLED